MRVTRFFRPSSPGFVSAPECRMFLMHTQRTDKEMKGRREQITVKDDTGWMLFQSLQECQAHATF